MKTLKSIGALLAGIIIGAALSIITDTLLEKAGIFPPIGAGFFVPWMLILALFYRTIYTIIGGYVTARLAPSWPILHVVMLGVIGIIVSAIGTVVGWDLSSHWYPIILTVIALPATYAGGKFCVRQRRNFCISDKKAINYPAVSAAG